VNITIKQFGHITRISRNHWRALRTAIKDPPCSWLKETQRKTTTDMVTLNRWNRSTVNQRRPSHGVTSSTGSHWLDWTRGDSYMYATSRSIIEHDSDDDDDENCRISSLVFYFAENQTEHWLKITFKINKYLCRCSDIRSYCRCNLCRETCRSR